MPPISRLDLPGIVESIRVLYRTIEQPPAAPWRPPAWLIDQYRKTTAGEEALRDYKESWVVREGHYWLIDEAARFVLDRLTPPFRHFSDDCREINDSELDLSHKAALLELRRKLMHLGWKQVGNRSARLETLHYLGSVLQALGQTADQGAMEGGEGGKDETSAPETQGQLTLGGLISRLESSEQARQWNSANANRVADAGRSVDAAAFRIYDAAQRWRPNPETTPGIHRIIVLCDERGDGTGLTAANVRWLRAAVCRALVCSSRDVDRLSLTEAADALDRRGRSEEGNPKRKRRGRRPDPGIDPDRDKRLCEDWRAAKGTGLNRAAFARERGITVKDLIDAQHRQKYRRTRDAE
jgi:hypothetical protein